MGKTIIIFGLGFTYAMAVGEIFFHYGPIQAGLSIVSGGIVYHMFEDKIKNL